MNLVLIIFVWGVLDVINGESCNGSHLSLPDIEKRIPSNTNTCIDSGVNCIMDRNLASGWYDVGRRNMPTDHSGLHPYRSCGTFWPIWMNGSVPKTTEGRMNRIAYAKAPSDVFARTFTIEVINCGPYMLYKLPPTNASYMAYCFEVGLGFSCTQQDPCSDTNAVCDSGNTCLCGSGYYDTNGFNNAGGICTPKVGLGSNCLQLDACNDSNAVCGSSNTCICGPGYYDNNGIATANGTCMPKVGLGSNCLQLDACNDSNAVCGSSNTCICGPGYYDNNGIATANGTCMPKVGLGSNCLQLDACNDSNAVCGSSNTCICGPGYYDNNGIATANGTCMPKVGLGSNCLQLDACNDSNAVCGSSNTCICGSGYYDNNGIATADGTCVAKVLLGSNCPQSDACTDSNAVCDSVNTCICGSGYYDNNGIATAGGTCMPNYTTPGVTLLACEQSIDSKGTLWDFTYGNASVTKTCPSGFIGNVTRFCNDSGTWKNPNYGDCVNKTFISLKNEIEELLNGNTTSIYGNISTFLSKLNEATDPIQVELQKAEIEIVVSLLDKVVGINTTGDILSSSQVYENFLKTASNVIDVNNKDSWQVLTSNKKLGAEIVFKSVEGFLQRISDSLNKDQRSSNLTLEYKNIDVEIGHKLPLEFPRDNNNSSQEKRPFATGFILPILGDNNYTYAAVLYKNVSAFLQSRVVQHGEPVDMRLDIGPEVLSLQLFPKPVKLHEPLQLMFKHFYTKYTNPRCSYWKFNAIADGQGAWSNDGCDVVSSNSSGICCECNHLTNFAILMAPSEVNDPEHNATLSIISIVGCAVSLVCLTLTLLGYLIVWRFVKSRRTYILMNICLALLLSYTTFVAGVNRTENKIVCIVIAALLHYFFLTVFFLMLVQGIWIAVSVLYVFATRSYLHWLLPLGWLIPMVIVGASLGISRLDGYGNERFCYLSVRDGLVWAFAGPAALVIVINGIIIVITIRKLLNTSALLTKTKQERARASLKGLAVLLPLTGVTWALGIFSVNEKLLVFQYLFTIVNSFQGLFVFLVHCVGNEEMRNAIKNKRRRQKALDTYRQNSKTVSNNDSVEMSTKVGSGTN